MENNTTKIKHGKKPLVRAIILLVVACMLLGFAFLPIGTFRLTGEEVSEQLSMDEDLSVVMMGLDFSLHFSIIDMYIFLYDNLQDIDMTVDASKSIYPKSDLWDEMYDATNSIGDMDISSVIAVFTGDFDFMTEKVEEMLYLTLRLYLQNEDISVKADLVATVIISTVYLLLCAAFVVLAIINLIRTWKYGTNSGTAAIVLLCLIPALVLALYAAFFVTMDAGVIGVGTYLSIGVSILAMVGIAVFTPVADKRPRNQRALAMRIGTVVLAGVMIAMAFAPMMTMSVKAKFLMREEVVEATLSSDATLYGGLNIPQENYEEIRDTIAEELPQLETVTKVGFENGAKSSVAEHLALFGLLCADKGSGTTYFSLTSIPLMLTCVAAALVIWQCLCYFITGRDMKHFATIFKSVALGFAIVFLILNIVLVCVSNAGAARSTVPVISDAANYESIEAETKILGEIIDFGIGVGSIAAAVAAIALIALPYARFDRKREDEDADVTIFYNAPVSVPPAEEMEEAPAIAVGSAEEEE